MKKRLLLCFVISFLILFGTGVNAAEENDTDALIVEEIILEDAVEEAANPAGIVEDGMNPAEFIEDEINSAEIMGEESTQEISLENDGDSVVLSDEELILSIEELESFEDLVEIPVETVENVVTEEFVEICQVSEAGLASNAKRPDFSVYSRGQYSGSYGAQLTGDGITVYNAMSHAFLTERSAEEFMVSFAEPYVFAVEDIGDEANRVWNKEGEDYLAAVTEMKYHVQSAYDAFIYDSPQAFWVSTFSFGWSVTLYFDDNGHYDYGKISGITIFPKERYDGASGEVNAFDAAVDNVAAEIRKGLSQNAAQTEIIEEIHDWLCFHVEYQENTYAHTAAGVFLKGRKVVCEGYAKAFTLLCDEFGIESVLIPGGARKSNGSVEGHMWNYVQLNGAWYMIDTTWDDQKSYISKKYFLAGNGSQGFNAVIREERTLYTDFSASGSGTQNFILPVLNEAAYSGTWHEWNTTKVTDTEPTCSVEGSKSYHCRKCGDSKGNSAERIPTTEHDYGEWQITVQPSCSTQGTKIRVCTCGAEESDTIATLDHNWNTEYTLDQEMTCEQDEKKSFHCKDCNAINEASVVITRTSGHAWDAGTVTITPSCTQTGQRTYVCSTCKAEEYDEILVTEHNYGEWKITVQPGCKTAGTKIRSCTCGEKETETIPAAGHQWEKKYTVDRKATCTAYGTESIHCSECDERKEGSSRKTARLEASFTASELVLKTGQSTNKLKVTGLTGGDYIKSWSSSNQKIIGVTKKGKITAKNKTGKANVIITLANDKYGTTRKYQIPVKVQKKEVKTLQISGLEKTLTLKKGKKYTLNPVRVPFTSGQEFKYSSKKPKIVSVSSKGVITAKAAGKTKIIVRSGDAKFVITVTVPETTTKKIQAKKKVSVKKGKSVTLKVRLVPANSDQGISFVSKNKKIAVVNQKGKITGKKKGTAKIIIKSGKITHTCTVTVK